MSAPPAEPNAALMGAFVEGVLDGRITSSDLFPGLAQRVQEGWEWVTRSLRDPQVDPNLFEVIDTLRKLEPQFPAADFLLALTHEKSGNREQAKRFFEAQMTHPSGLLKDQSRQLLESLSD